ncbi:hypothetical protein BD410DRAFT_61280 [Rickenella mellea]|uniref:Uncharacterized protein n=1 Tax=Rickenella mellea TaxID=50990 RepID=A0A4Y7QBY3_9AGAM|nr:hypothetical protein BD410DRAFT_61280 [Rickenella mellea]
MGSYCRPSTQRTSRSPHSQTSTSIATASPLVHRDHHQPSSGIGNATVFSHSSRTLNCSGRRISCPLSTHCEEHQVSRGCRIRRESVGRNGTAYGMRVSSGFVCCARYPLSLQIDDYFRCYTSAFDLHASRGYLI